MALFLPISFALACLIWGAVYVRFTGYVGAFLAVIFVGCCFGHPFLKFGPLTLDRILFFFLAFYYVVMRVQQGRNLLWRMPDLAVAFMMASIGLSTLTSDWRSDQGKALIDYTVFFGMPVAMYAMARSSPFEDRHIRIVQWSLCFFCIYLGATAVAEKFEWYAFVFPSYIASPKFEEFLGRARGPFLNPCANGLYLTTGFAASWFLCFQSSIRSKFIASFGMIAACVGIAFTMTRSVWMGCMLVAFLLFLLHVPKQMRIGMLAAAGLLVLAAAGASWANIKSFKRDKNVSVEDMEKSAELRPLLAAVAWEMFKDRPLLGCGFGRYLEESLPYFTARKVDRPIELAKNYVQHNVFLAILVENGLIGLMSYLAMLSIWCRDAIRVWRSRLASRKRREAALLFLCCLIPFVVNGMFHDMSIINMVHILLFFLAGLMYGTAPESQ